MPGAPLPLLRLATSHTRIQTHSSCSVLDELGGHPRTASTLLKCSLSVSTCCLLVSACPTTSCFLGANAARVSSFSGCFIDLVDLHIPFVGGGKLCCTGIYICYYHIPWEQGYSWHTQLLSEAYGACLGVGYGADCPLGVMSVGHFIG